MNDSDEPVLVSKVTDCPPTVTVELPKLKPVIVTVFPPAKLVVRGEIELTNGTDGVAGELLPWLGAGAAAAIVYASVLVVVPAAESVTCTFTEPVACAVGVPVIAPVWAFKVSPAGRVLGLTRAQAVYVPEPPLALSWSVYDWPTVPFASAVFVIESCVVNVCVVPQE
jgi:hypothetical protein